MKKITALLLCFLLLCMCSVTAFAAGPEDEITTTVISVTVPDSHRITVMAQGAQVFYRGISGEKFTVGRLSEPRLLIRAESGKIIESVTQNGRDVTDLLHGGYLDLAPVYEDQVITVTTAEEPALPMDLYTVKGCVTLNAQPLANVDLVLSSGLMTVKTNRNGNFEFTDVKTGEHSLTVLKDGKVIGYLSFTLQKDNKTDIILRQDGTYSLLVNQKSAGVELHLVLNEEKGILSPADVKPVQKAEILVPQTGDPANLACWLILSILSVTCIVVLGIYRKKKIGN